MVKGFLAILINFIILIICVIILSLFEVLQIWSFIIGAGYGIFTIVLGVYFIE
jgi:hypothetical protein